jgi:hypothetical protein
MVKEKAPVKTTDATDFRTGSQTFEEKVCTNFLL